MSKNIVFQGWLTKSPPTKRVWRTRWHRRWFALRQSGELPGQYFLDYYTDRSCRRLKGTINLDLCEQVDAGLHMERSGTGAPDPSIRGSVFRIQTQSRIYHLEADCQADMEKWVDAICRVCGLRAIEETSEASATYQNTTGPRSLSPEVYIAISECTTGLRTQNTLPLMRPQRRYAHTSPAAPMPTPSSSRDEGTEREHDENSSMSMEEFSSGSSMQYYNVPALPPAVDRALKPRPASHSVGDESPSDSNGGGDEYTSSGLVYSELDLPVYSPDRSTLAASQERRRAIGGMSTFDADRECPYRQVDFLKTEAFNMTRQDAEASRGNQI